MPVIMIVFSLAGNIMGLCEELIPFAMILIPLLIRLGYDSLTAMMVVYMSCMVGFSATWMNPFTLLIAQGLAEVPLMSGAPLRIVLYVISMAILIFFTIRRALKCKADPTFSMTYESDQKNFRSGMEEAALGGGVEFTFGHGLVLLTLVAGFTWVFWGVMTRGWYVGQLSGIFLAMGMVGGAIGVIFKLNDMKLNDVASAFKQGLSDLAPVVAVLALGKGIGLVLGGTDNALPSTLNTILYFAGKTLGGLPAVLSAWGMYIFQYLFDFLVCSGPAQAAVVMPIMAPLSDMLGVTRQTACLAFQLGDGFCNMINPTSASLMAYLAVAKMDFGTWCKFQWKWQGVYLVLGSIFMVVAVIIGY